MKTTTLVALAALSSSALGAVTLSVSKSTTNAATTKMKKRQLSERATITESLFNNATGGEYIASVEVGTPKQNVTLAIDTGSSDVWLLSYNASLCTDKLWQEYYGFGCDAAATYNPTKSSTYKYVDDTFSIQYADNSGAQGNYIKDTFSIGGASLSSLQMGLGLNSSIGTGLLGIGYDTNEASFSTYSSIIDDMVSQNLINTKAYSLYLDDLDASTGSIIFGGIDSDKFYGELVQLPIVADTDYYGNAIYAEFNVEMSSFSITNETNVTTTLTTAAYNETAVLDSGTTLTYLPDILVARLYKYLNAYDDTYGTGAVFVDCALRDNSSGMYLTYGFSNKVNISVPIHELIFDLSGLFSLGEYTLPTDIPFTNACALGVYASGGSNILGDTFLRSAYVVYDLENNLVALAQTNFKSTTTKIVEIQKSATAIPSVSGVSGFALATGTGTASGTKGTSGSGSGSASGSSTSSKSAGMMTVPAFDVRGLVVAGLAAGMAVIGGGWFVCL